jgi:thiamine biosynthesis lipoprotein
MTRWRTATGGRRAAALFFALALATIVGACEKPAAVHKETLYVFGTLVEVTIRGADEDTARRAVAEVARGFQRMHKDWHAWKPGALTRLNEAFAEGRRTEVDDFLLRPLRQAKRFYRLSDGLFNPAIGRLIGAWGFHQDELPEGTAPDPETIRALVDANPTMDDVIIDGHTVYSDNPAVSLDFGGFAKGTALDWAVATLKRLGIKNAVVNAGGDLDTLGDAGDRPWTVGIRHPTHWGVIASVTLADDEAIYTSGNYERFRMDEGIKRGHIIDPRDGLPVRHIVSASVIGHDGALCDAAATALSVAGPEDWYRVAKRMGVKFALLVDAEGTVYANPAMARRVTFENGEPKKLVLSDPL